MRVTIKQSKTDPFRKGVDLYIGRTGNGLCPVAALLNYQVEKGAESGTLFIFQDGRFFTRQRFVDSMRRALQEAGIDDTKYCGHSFRIGEATTAAEHGMEDSMIKT